MGILPVSKSDDIRPPSSNASRPDSYRILPEFGHGQKPAGSSQNGRNSAESDQIQPLILPDLAKMAGIQRSLAGIQQRRPDVAGFWQQLYFQFS